jgi:rhodanese-related sulfurtransferase/type 1 glutamine amidotransferase
MKKILRLSILAAVFSLLFYTTTPELRAQQMKRPTIVMLSGAKLYESEKSLTQFKDYLENNFPLTTILIKNTDKTNLPNLELLKYSDLAVIFIRRMTLKEDQIESIRTFIEQGKPVVAIRTASHAFENWKEFDSEVLGGNYHGHYDKDRHPTIRQEPKNKNHPILKDVNSGFVSKGSMYKTSPLKQGTEVLLNGKINGEKPEPIAWTHLFKNSRVFYTSLGHPDDFNNDSFRNLLVNAIYWGLNQPKPDQFKVIPPTDLGPEQFAKLLMVSKRKILLDVRTPKEIEEEGFIKGMFAINIYDQSFKTKVIILDRNTPVFVYCKSGGRSSKACSILQELKFKEVYNLDGGITAWKATGKPVELKP